MLELLLLLLLLLVLPIFVLRKLQDDIGRMQKLTQKIWILDGQMVKKWTVV